MKWRPKRATVVPFLNLLEFLSSRFSSPSIREHFLVAEKDSRTPAFLRLLRFFAAN